MKVKTKRPKKLCPICNDWFERPKGKSTKVWNAQVCCGLDCANLSRRKENPVGGTYRRKELTPGNRRYSSSRG